MRIEQHPEVSLELQTAAARFEEDWYGRGERFLESFNRTTAGLPKRPTGCPHVLDEKLEKVLIHVGLGLITECVSKLSTNTIQRKT